MFGRVLKTPLGYLRRAKAAIDRCFVKKKFLAILKHWKKTPEPGTLGIVLNFSEQSFCRTSPRGI